MNTITPSATGRRDDRDGTPYVVLERTLTAPIADVWAAVGARDLDVLNGHAPTPCAGGTCPRAGLSRRSR